MLRKRINFYLSHDHINKLKSLHDITVSEHIRRALDDYLKQFEPKGGSTSPSGKKPEVFPSP